MKKDIKNIADLWPILSDKYPDTYALIDEYSQYSVTFKQFYLDISRFAASLQKLGLKRSDHVAFFSENSSKWMTVDQAMMKCGIVNAVRGSLAPLSELKYIYQHSESIALFTDKLDLIDKMQNFLIENNAKFIVYIGGEKITKNYKIKILTFEKMLEMSDFQDFLQVDYERYDIATIVYSSGTTGKPKGVMLSNANLIEQFYQLVEALKLKPKSKVVSILPIWHMYERMCEYYLLGIGITQAYTNIKNFKIDLKKYNPHYLISVPRIWEAVYESVLNELKKKSLIEKKIFDFMYSLSLKRKNAQRVYLNLKIDPEKPNIFQKCWAILISLLISPFDVLAKKFLYKKIKSALGKNFVKGISGGGALSWHVEDFFESVGIEILVGYGLTETSPVLTVRSSKNNKKYSCGKELPATSIKIVEPSSFKPLKAYQKGLVLVKGPQIMRGYYKDQKATKEVLFPDGFFSTGDIGFLTSDRNLVLTGRIKDTIVLSNGENIEPFGLEIECLKSNFVYQIVFAGQDKNALSALVVPNCDFVKNWCFEKKLDFEIAKYSFNLKNEILQELRTLIQKRPNFRKFEYLSDIRLLWEPFEVSNGLMTQTGKIKKLSVLEKNKDLIESIYKK